MSTEQVTRALDGVPGNRDLHKEDGGKGSESMPELTS